MHECCLGCLISLWQTPWPTHCQSARLPHTHSKHTLLRCSWTNGHLNSSTHSSDYMCVSDAVTPDWQNLLFVWFHPSALADFLNDESCWFLILSNPNIDTLSVLNVLLSHVCALWRRKASGVFLTSLTETRTAFYELIISFRDAEKKLSWKVTEDVSEPQRLCLFWIRGITYPQSIGLWHRLWSFQKW